MYLDMSTRPSFHSYLVTRRMLRSTLFPYTTLFRSVDVADSGVGLARDVELVDAQRLRRVAGDGLLQQRVQARAAGVDRHAQDRKSTRLNSQSPDHLVCRLLLE